MSTEDLRNLHIRIAVLSATMDALGMHADVCMLKLRGHK